MNTLNDASTQYGMAIHGQSTAIERECFLFGRQLKALQAGRALDASKYAQMRVEAREQQRDFLNRAQSVEAQSVGRFREEKDAILGAFKPYESALGNFGTLYIETAISRFNFADQVRFLRAIGTGLNAD